MKKHIVLFSSLLLVGTVLTVGAIEASAETGIEVMTAEGTPENTSTEIARIDGVVYATDETVGAKEVFIRSHEIDKIPETLVIPQTITDEKTKIDYTVVRVNAGALGFSEKETVDVLKSVTFPKTIKEIQGSAFRNRSKLETATLNEGLVAIGGSVFFNNISLKTVKLPSTLTSIGIAAFQNCTSLTSIEIPNSVTTIKDSAFSDATALTNVKLPSNLTAISNSLFQGCKSLKTVIIPDKVSTIASHAFSNSGLTEIKIPTGVTKKANLDGEAIFSEKLEKITFTSPIADGTHGNVFMEPRKAGYTFEGWLKAGETTPVSHNGLSEIAKTGNATVTAQWKEDGSAPSSDSSDATIKLLPKQETGAISFGNVTTDAKIAFKDVTLKGTEAATTTEDTAKTNAKVVVNDTRSDKSKGWTVEAKYQDTNFVDKGLKLSLKPTAASGTVSNVDLSTTASTVFKKGTGQADQYDVKLNPSLAIPTNFSVSTNAETTKINWTLTPDE